MQRTLLPFLLACTASPLPTSVLPGAIHGPPVFPDPPPQTTGFDQVCSQHPRAPEHAGCVRVQTRGDIRLEDYYDEHGVNVASIGGRGGARSGWWTEPATDGTGAVRYSTPGLCSIELLDAMGRSLDRRLFRDCQGAWVSRVVTEWQGCTAVREETFEQEYGVVVPKTLRVTTVDEEGRAASTAELRRGDGDDAGWVLHQELVMRYDDQGRRIETLVIGEDRVDRTSTGWGAEGMRSQETDLHADGIVDHQWDSSERTVYDVEWECP